MSKQRCEREPCSRTAATEVFCSALKPPVVSQVVIPSTYAPPHTTCIKVRRKCVTLCSLTACLMCSLKLSSDACIYVSSSSSKHCMHLNEGHKTSFIIRLPYDHPHPSSSQVHIRTTCHHAIIRRENQFERERAVQY